MTVQYLNYGSRVLSSPTITKTDLLFSNFILHYDIIVIVRRFLRSLRGYSSFNQFLNNRTSGTKR